MLLLTISSTTIIDELQGVAPFVRSHLFEWATDSWWSTIGGSGGPFSSNPLILEVLVNLTPYQEVQDLETCTSNEESWFYDTSAKQLYIHFNHDIVPEASLVQYGRGIGYSDNDLVYVDGTQYLPLITSAPGINKQQDIRQYQRLAFLAGEVTLSNNSGILDSELDEDIIGNAAILQYVPDSEITDNQVSLAKVETLRTYFIETISATPQEFTLSLQDKRKVSVKVPQNTFGDQGYLFLNPDIGGTLIPLVYGSHRNAPGTPVDSSFPGVTDATYRVAITATSIESVEVLINETWESRTPSNINLMNGEFTIPNAREAVNKEPYECRVNFTGIAVEYAPDIIVDLYTRFLDESFIDVYFDTTTWNIEKTKVSGCSLYLDSSTDIFDAIARIQNGIFPSFRFDITPDGRKTIKADDRGKAVSEVVNSYENRNIDSTDVNDDINYLFAEVTVAYDKDQSSGRFMRTSNSDYKNSVIDKYQIRNTVEIEALVNNSTDALAMVDKLALDFSEPTRTVRLEAVGDKFFAVDIYDVITVNTYPNDDIDLYTIDESQRAFAGVLNVQVIGVVPNYQQKTVRIVGRVLKDRPFVPGSFVLIGTEAGGDLIMEDGSLFLAEEQ